MSRDWWQGWLLPSYSHRFAIVSRVAPALLPGYLRLDWAGHVDDSGWQEPIATATTPSARQRGIEEAYRVHGQLLQNFHKSEPSCRALEDLLRLCAKEAIPAALVWMPEATAFRCWYSAATLEQVRGLINGLSRAYGVPVINAREWVDDEQFADCHHLLRGGAQVFTERFGKEVVLPLVGRRQAGMSFAQALGGLDPAMARGAGRENATAKTSTLR
jgi:hypothetical protein